MLLNDIFVAKVDICCLFTHACTINDWLMLPFRRANVICLLILAHNCSQIADFGLARDMEDYVYMAMHPNRKLPTKWLAPESMLDASFTVLVCAGPLITMPFDWFYPC